MPNIEPLVSIVTPFYNTEDFLTECIESVLAQTYQNWEYILVNNCSTDHSAEIAQRYLIKDQRIRFINNQNFLNQVQNYNHALRQISSDSKYCKIVQADDWIFPECISRMVEIADANPSIGIVSAFSLSKKSVVNLGLPYDKTFFKGHEVCRKALFEDQHYFGSPTSILLRSEIIRGRTQLYLENHPYEDTDLCYDLLRQWDFGFVHQILTYIRTQDGSIIFNARKFDPYYLDRFIVANKYGKTYLDSNEFLKLYSEIEEKYYSFLAKHIFSGRRSDFWEYHTRGLTTIEYKLNKFLLTKFILLHLLDICFNLKSSASILFKKIKSYLSNKRL